MQIVDEVKMKINFLISFSTLDRVHLQLESCSQDDELAPSGNVGNVKWNFYLRCSPVTNRNLKFLPQLSLAKLLDSSIIIAFRVRVCGKFHVWMIITKRETSMAKFFDWNIGEKRGRHFYIQCAVSTKDVMLMRAIYIWSWKWAENLIRYVQVYDCKTSQLAWLYLTFHCVL